MRPRVAVKVCGITRVEDAELAVALGASAIGFVFWPGSPREISPTAASAIADVVGRAVVRVGVFVNATPAAVAGTVREVGLDAVQLHGDEVPDRFRDLGARVIRAVVLRTDTEVEQAAALAPWMTVLVDAADPVRRGGTGRLASWTHAAALARHREVWLAGGLTPENVDEAIRTVQPALVDVSSGVELSPGVKDANRMRAFLAGALGSRGEAM